MPRQIFDDDEPLLDYGDMDQLAELGIGDRGYANVEPPGGSNHLFGDQFERRARELAHRSNPQSPIVQDLPIRSHPMWDGNNEIGQSVPFAPDALNRQMVLKMPTWGPPRVWTIALGINQVADVSQRWGVKALIQAGTGGAIQEIQIDWTQGTSIQVVANAITIIAEWRFDFATDERPSDAVLTATVSEYGGLCSIPPTFSQELQRINTLLPAGQTDAFAIPRFARQLMLSRKVSNLTFLAGTTYLFTPLPTVVNVDATWTGADILTVGNRIPIPPTSRYLIGSNAGLADGVVLANAHWLITG